MIDVLVWIELAVAAVCIGRFAWGMTRGFTRPDGLTPRMAAAGTCGTITGAVNLIALFFFNPHTPAGTLIGLVLFTAAWLLFESATRAMKDRPLSFAFSSDLPRHLLHRGPYRLVRHPFYSSFLLAWVASTVATGQLLLLLPLALMFFIYNATATLEEAKFAASPLAGEYAAYRARTGKYLPWLPGLLRPVTSA